MNIAIVKPEERAEVLAWAKSQEGHENFSFLNWSEVVVLRADSGTILALMELASIQIAECVFGGRHSARETHASWEALNAWLAEKQRTPVFLVDRKSKLAPFAGKLMRRIFEGFDFFRK